MVRLQTRRYLHTPVENASPSGMRIQKRQSKPRQLAARSLARFIVRGQKKSGKLQNTLCVLAFGAITSWSSDAAAACAGANSNDWNDDTAALQACLNNGGTVLLDPGSPGYVVNGLNGNVEVGLVITQGSNYRGNTIYSGVMDRLAMGILIGSHPWSTNHIVSNAGSVTGNTSRDNVINMVIDGVQAGLVSRKLSL